MDSSVAARGPVIQAVFRNQKLITDILEKSLDRVLYAQLYCTLLGLGCLIAFNVYGWDVNEELYVIEKVACRSEQMRCAAIGKKALPLLVVVLV